MLLFFLLSVYDCEFTMQDNVDGHVRMELDNIEVDVNVRVSVYSFCVSFIGIP